MGHTEVKRINHGLKSMADSISEAVAELEDDGNSGGP